jgi:late competence protein required for DNA uptake (superfamily II DNA/RNA helicase)
MASSCKVWTCKEGFRIKCWAQQWQVLEASLTSETTLDYSKDHLPQNFTLCKATMAHQLKLVKMEWTCRTRDTHNLFTCKTDLSHKVVARKCIEIVRVFSNNQLWINSQEHSNTKTNSLEATWELTNSPKVAFNILIILLNSELPSSEEEERA